MNLAAAAGRRHSRSGRFVTRAKTPAKSRTLAGVLFDDKVATAGMAVLRKVDQRACTVVDVYRRHPVIGAAKLDDPAACCHGIDDPISKPRAVAVHQTWKCRDDRKTSDDVSVETIESSRQAASSDRRPPGNILGDGTVSGWPVTAGVRGVDNAPRRSRGESVKEQRVRRQPLARHKLDPSPCGIPSTVWIRRNVEDPVCSGFVLPRTRVREIAENRDRPARPQQLQPLPRSLPAQTLDVRAV